MLAVLRDTDLGPGTVITGTPIQSVSHVVVPPLYGVVSNAISTALNQRKYSSSKTYGTIVILETAIPASRKSWSRRSLACPSGTPITTKRESGNRLRMSDQSPRVVLESLAMWLNEPNVIKPFRWNGGATA